MTDLDGAPAVIVVRGFGYGVTHVAIVPRSQLALKPGFVAKPIAGRCGRTIRSVRDVVVVMSLETPIRCRECARLGTS